MPGPDPDGIEPGENWPRNVQVYHFLCENKRHRTDRAARILNNARWGEWSCKHCGGPVPIWRRADAVYCSTGCRKRAKRQRQAGGGQISVAFGNGTGEDSAPPSLTQFLGADR